LTNARATSGTHTRGTGRGAISVLTPVQERFLAGFFSGSDCPFYLSGGTALSAYYLHHRYSDDLDFFTRDRETLRGTDRYVERATLAAGLRVERVTHLGDLVKYFLSGDPQPEHRLVNIEFVFDTPPYFAAPQSFDGVLVDDLLSIAVNKVTIHTRYEPKDYVDLYLIVRTGRLRLEDLIPKAKEKMVGLDELTIGAHFAKVEDLPNLEAFERAYMLLPIDWVDLVDFYREWSARLFDMIPPRGRS
jgi:hypothetical protein